MTTTLVLGDGTSSAMDYAAWLLRQKGPYSTIDAAQSGSRLAIAILGSRRPMLLHGIEGWIATVVAKRDLDAIDTYAEAETSLSGHVDEVVVARRHVPMDVVTVTQAAECSELSPRAYRNRLSYVNARLSASSDRVHFLLGGRIIDLSSAPIIPR